MSRSVVKYLNQIDGDINLRDFQHASRLYLTDDLGSSKTYAFVPKAKWIYYVEIKINPLLESAILESETKDQFRQWYNRYNGKIGLLAKTVDMPKITIDTEIINQYNKKTVIQKGINYGTIGITFHDDMSNMTTNLWKSYYQYYYGDSIDFINKYRIGKYESYTEGRNFRYGLNNNQTVPFFVSFEIYQLYQRKFTKFEIINPLIKSWDHESLDQDSTNQMLTNKMSVEYETLIYDTSDDNYITSDNLVFNNVHYDRTVSPLPIGGKISDDGLPLTTDNILGSLNNPKIGPLGRVVDKQSAGARPVRTNSISSSTFKSSTAIKTADGTIIFQQSSNQHSSVGISVPNGQDPNSSVTPTAPVNLRNLRSA
jgi:hypothetical protein